MSNLYYFHTYKVSSGKDQKVIKKIYTDEKEAKEHHLLMGGKMVTLKEVEVSDA